jgi:hypothetical protein
VALMELILPYNAIITVTKVGNKLYRSTLHISIKQIHNDQQNTTRKTKDYVQSETHISIQDAKI